MGAFVDLTGQTFDRLVVLHRGKGNKAGATWKCACTCGQVTEVSSGKLRSGHTKSCGCLKKDKKANLKHGLANKSSTYKTWKEMRNRCNNPNATQYKWYGAKGIRVCEEWGDYTAFLRDMGDRPSGKTLDRVDPGKGYSKNNCRWASPVEQATTNRGCFRTGNIPWNSRKLTK